MVKKLFFDLVSIIKYYYDMRGVNMNYGNKILIMGGSCAGKSTTAERLGKKLNIPVMFMDLYDPYAVAVGAGRDARKQQMQDTIQKTITQSRWIIEGVYQWYAFEERMAAADVLVVLRAPAIGRVWRYIKTCALGQKRHGRSGFSAKNFRLEHVWYMLRHNDAPYDLIMQTARKYDNLRVVELKSFRAIDNFINSYSR